ncbi:MAG: FkbM family methyltransferase [Actinomycetales bacterium]|nr:FkbM family methyltransferase [Actinomycetales bacterium]
MSQATNLSEGLDDVADRELLADLSRVLTAGDVVLDIGAHHGEFAQRLMSRIDVAVHAFEPVPDSFALLTAAAGSWPALRPVPMAVDDVPYETSTEFHVQVGDAGSSLLMPIPHQTSTWATYKSSIEVRCTSITAYVDAVGVARVGLLKSDAQGADLRVIRSAEPLFRAGRIGAVLVEANFHAFYRDQNSFADIVAYMDTAGFFLAGFYRHFNRLGFLWWADVLFLPRVPQFAT